MAVRKKIHNMSQGSPNQEFMQEKVQKGDNQKKKVTMNPSKAWNAKQNFFWPSKNLYKQCEPGVQE